jgi:hypothetical protein
LTTIPQPSVEFDNVTLCCEGDRIRVEGVLKARVNVTAFTRGHLQFHLLDAKGREVAENRLAINWAKTEGRRQVTRSSYPFTQEFRPVCTEIRKIQIEYCDEAHLPEIMEDILEIPSKKH